MDMDGVDLNAMSIASLFFLSFCTFIFILLQLLYWPDFYQGLKEQHRQDSEQLHFHSEPSISRSGTQRFKQQQKNAGAPKTPVSSPKHKKIDHETSFPSSGSLVSNGSTKGGRKSGGFRSIDFSGRFHVGSGGNVGELVEIPSFQSGGQSSNQSTPTSETSVSANWSSAQHSVDLRASLLKTKQQTQSNRRSANAPLFKSTHIVNTVKQKQSFWLRFMRFWPYYLRGCILATGFGLSGSRLLNLFSQNLDPNWCPALVYTSTILYYLFIFFMVMFYIHRFEMLVAKNQQQEVRKVVWGFSFLNWVSLLFAVEHLITFEPRLASFGSCIRVESEESLIGIMGFAIITIFLCCFLLIIFMKYLRELMEIKLDEDLRSLAWKTKYTCSLSIAVMAICNVIYLMYFVHYSENNANVEFWIRLVDITTSFELLANVFSVIFVYSRFGSMCASITPECFLPKVEEDIKVEEQGIELSLMGSSRVNSHITKPQPPSQRLTRLVERDYHFEEKELRSPTKKIAHILTRISSATEERKVKYSIDKMLKPEDVHGVRQSLLEADALHFDTEKQSEISISKTQSELPGMTPEHSFQEALQDHPLRN
jgi:hypothetical protein